MKTQPSFSEKEKFQNFGNEVCATPKYWADVRKIVGFFCFEKSEDWRLDFKQNQMMSNNFKPCNLHQF